MKNQSNKKILITNQDLDTARRELKDDRYMEYIFHKWLDDPDAVFKNIASRWSYPNTFLLKYFRYFHSCIDFIKGKTIFEIGSTFNLNSIHAIQKGARQVTAIEPDKTKFVLGNEHIEMRGLQDRIVLHNVDIEKYFTNSQPKNFDVVFFLDVLYYLHNPLGVLEKIKTHCNPEYIFFSNSVERGDCEASLWHPPTDVKDVHSTKDIESFSDKRIAFRFNRSALLKIFEYLQFEIVKYWDSSEMELDNIEEKQYKDGRNIFYLLRNRK